MKKLTVALLVGIFALVPVLAVAQSGGGTGGTQAPGSSPTDRPMGSPGSGQPMPPGGGAPGDPAASPPGSGDTLSQHTTKGACEKAGGMWTESTRNCKKK
jgi:hypothetical protein